MFQNLLEIVFKAIGYIFEIRLFDIPRLIFYVGVAALISYATAMIFIGFPITFYEHFSKKKVNSDKEDKVIKIVTIILTCFFTLVVLYQMAT